MDQKKKVLLVISVMIVVIGGLLFVSRNMEAPSAIDHNRMTSLQREIEAFASENGRAPIDLAELSLKPEEVQDRTGNSIVYELDGKKVTLKALGGDQKEGGHMFKADRQFVFYLKEAKPEAQPLEIDPKIVKEGEKRKRPPKEWVRLDWEEKRKFLFGMYAPSDNEKALISDALPDKAQVQPLKKRKLLVFYRCQYPHASIATGNYAFEEIGKATGAYEVTLSEDPTVFTQDSLAQYDAVLLNNTTDWDVTVGAAGVDALINFVKAGGGLIGIHAASDACKKHAEGSAMIGGVFRCHPWLPKGTWAFKLEQKHNPLNAAFFKEGFWMRDEIYLYKENTFTRKRSSVLVSLDMAQEHNCTSPDIHKKHRSLAQKDGDYPVVWLHELGEGRVFYSNFGHNNMTYWQPQILRHYLDGIQYALGDIKADAVPSAEIKDLQISLAPAFK